MKKTETMVQVKEFEWLERIPEAVFIYHTDREEQIIYANQKLLKLFECESWEELVQVIGGTTFRDLVYKEDIERIEKEIQDQLDHEQAGFDRIEYRVQTKSGKLIYLEDFGYRIEDPTYGPLFYVSVVDANSQFIRYAMDEMTGLPGMYRFLQYFGRKIDRMTPEDAGKFQVCFFNICNFKMFNIHYGEKEGDRVLLQFSQFLKEQFPNDYVARFSDDHFVVFSKDTDVAECVDQVHSRFSLNYGKYNLKLKTGVYRVMDQEKSAQVCCDLAKAACDSIRNEKTHLKYYDESMNRRLEISNYVVQTIDKAIENHYIKVYYQPVVRTLTSQLCGMEALARWADPQYGLLSPGYFIPALEENRQIHKLDKYVIREVCRQLQECLNNRMPVVPVSLNLSRLDFLECDIVEFIEQTIEEFDVPRDLLNIEITESTMIDDPEMIQEELTRFHKIGYQVWMDDFGSGYSSLNILKDYRFDQLKIDMEFLSSFTETSREIITSVVDMSKRIGIQTLAEGVETKEQFEFLKKIGCEKTQGYYFGKPLPYEECLKNCEEKHLSTELRRWRKYYDAIGQINFVTDKTLALIEYNGRHISYLQVNEAYMNVIKDTGILTLEQLDTFTNRPQSPLTRRFYNFLDKAVNSPQAQSLEYTINGYYIMVLAQKVSSAGAKSCYQLEIRNLTQSEEETYQFQHDHIYRMIYHMYDEVYLIDIHRHTIDPVVSRVFHEREVLRISHGESMTHGMIVNIGKQIYPMDRDAFVDWCDIDSLDDRIAKEGRGYVAAYFRTKNSRGSYDWKAHTVMRMPGEEDVYLYTIKYSSINDEETAQAIADIRGLVSKEHNHDRVVLFESLMNSQKVNFFWKGADRKFLGANRCFREYFGLESSNELMGKTEEELGWLTVDETFYGDETNVLQRGDVVYDRPTEIINHGIKTEVLITKMPIFDDGKIVGIVGYFYDSERFHLAMENNQKLSMLDRATGLMNVYGLMSTLTEYMERRDTQGERFDVIRLDVPEYLRILESYGDEIRFPLLDAIGSVIARIAGANAVCARTFDAIFFVCVRNCSESELHVITNRLEREIQDIHTVQNQDVTLAAKTRILNLESCSSLSEFVTEVMRRE